MHMNKHHTVSPSCMIQLLGMHHGFVAHICMHACVQACLYVIVIGCV